MSDPAHTFADGFGNWHAKSDDLHEAILTIDEELIARGPRECESFEDILEEHVHECHLHEGYFCENEGHHQTV